MPVRYQPSMPQPGAPPASAAYHLQFWDGDSWRDFGGPYPQQYLCGVISGLGASAYWQSRLFRAVSTQGGQPLLGVSYATPPQWSGLLKTYGACP